MTASIFIFNMAKVVTLTLGGNTGAALMNYPINSTDFKLIKGITNEIFFFVKDVDRHPITANALANAGIGDLRIIITDSDDRCLLLGSNVSDAIALTTSYIETTTTLSNSVVITTNTTVITSNTTSNSSGSNSIVSNSTMLVPTPGAGEYTVPNFVNAIVVETWGPGGAGVNSPETGAAGGAYASKSFSSVTTGDTFAYYVGNSATPEQATMWGSSTDANAAIFGAWGGAWISNNVTDVSHDLGSPFGAYDVGFYGGIPTTGNTIGQASAWSGGNAASNPAGLNVSNEEGGGKSTGNTGTSPGGGAPATSGIDTVFGGPGQIRITEYYDTSAMANALANSNTNSDSSNSNVTSNSVTITNSVTTVVTYVSNTVNVDPSVLIPAPGIDPAKGVWMLRLKAPDIADWPLGYLRYGVVGDRDIGDQIMLYTDRNYGPYSDLEVLAGPYPQPPEATIITANNCTQLGQSLYSGSYPGAAQVFNLSGQHGIVFQANAFTGSITIQASLENEPPTEDSEWFEANITSTTAGIIDSIGNQPPPPWNDDNGYGGTVSFSTETNGPIYISVVGNYMWVRFIVYKVPAAPGSWTSVDYRND